MWEVIEQIYDENFVPQKIISDNELAFLNATRAKFPEVPVQTCLFHIAENLRKNGLIFIYFKTIDYLKLF